MKVTGILYFLVLLFLCSAPSDSCAQQQPTALAEEDKMVNHIRNLDKKVREEGRFVDVIDQAMTTTLPVAIGTRIGGKLYALLIDSVVFTPKGAYFNAAISIEIPWNGKRIEFYARKVAFHSKGFSGTGKLALVQQKRIAFGPHVKLKLLSDPAKTYVVFGCAGYESMGLAGAFEFSDSFLVPDGIDGEPGTGKVEARFESVMQDPGDLLATVDIDPFQVKGLKGFGFYVQEALVDFSEVRNPATMHFPESYGKIWKTEPALESLWKGFYLRSVAVRMPSKFEQADGKRVSFGVDNLIIDESGLTGIFKANNVIPIEKGQMGTWPFSLDSLFIHIHQNQLLASGFGGKLEVPLFEKGQSLGYQAIIGTNDYYHFAASGIGKRHMPLWGAELDIHSSSIFEVAEQNGKFRPRLTLNGKLSIEKEQDGADVKITNIAFEQLQLLSEAPFVIPGTFGLTSESKSDNKIADFKISIQQIGLVSRADLLGLNLNVSVNLMEKETKGFKADGGFIVFGNMGYDNEWKFHSVELQNFGIDADYDFLRLRGEIAFYKEDPTYGKGFKGVIDAGFKLGSEEISVSAAAQFGKIDHYKYWYVDALAQMPQGIPVFPGFGFYGFGGGASYHMTQQRFEAIQVASTATSEGEVTVGTTFSGSQYVPDGSVGLGLRARVIVGTMPKPDPFNADATFEIIFNDGGGLNYVGFSGEGYFMCPADQRLDPAVKAGVQIDYLVNEQTLHGVLDVYVNVANGMLKGTQPGNKAGQAVLHFDPSDWYIYVGVPESRVGLSVFKLLTVQAYMMVGTDLPGMPAPPQAVSDILGGIDLNLMRDENALASGGGFAFGADVSFDTGSLTFLIFYGRFKGGLGFDIMLKDYGDNVKCVGRSGTIGIDGWYASGQAYAYIQGSIGLQVKVFGKRRSVEILDIGAAAVLQAKLPNPSFFKGNVGGYYSVLGGLVSGNVRFELTIGEECEIYGGSVLSSIDIIEEITPVNNENEVSVFTASQVLLSLPVEKPFEMIDLDGKRKVFRLVVEKFVAKNKGDVLPGALEYNKNKDVVVFKPYDILPPNATIEVFVELSFEEYKKGAWFKVLTDGKKEGESKTVTFSTGDAPDYIPTSNVQYSYPVNGQKNFHIQQSTVGYVQLKTGQPYLFKEDSTWTNYAVFKNKEMVYESLLTYNTTSKRIAYRIPEKLKTDQNYQFTILKKPVDVNNAINQNIITEQNRMQGDTSGMVQIRKREAKGKLENLKEQSLLTFDFTTSKFVTFNEKLSEINFSDGWFWQIQTGVNQIGANIQQEEQFDAVELKGTSGMKPLVRCKAKMTNDWLLDQIFPIGYANYPVDGTVSILWRKLDSLGLLPLNAVSLSGESGQRPVLTYDLSYYTYYDIFDMQQQAATLLTRNGNPSKPLLHLYKTSYPAIRPGNYEVDIQYFLPGEQQPSDVFSIVINYNEQW